MHRQQVEVLVMHETEMEESTNEFFGSKIGGERKVAESKVDTKILREVIKMSNPPHPIVFDGTTIGKINRPGNL